MLGVLEGVVQSLPLSVLRLDGTVLPKARQALVDKVNDKERGIAHVFLLSSKAGGVGLNLPSASKGILYDLDWNPWHDAGDPVKKT